MVKNAVDVVIGGLGYWMFGYGFSFGNGRGSNFFIGFGEFFLDADEREMGTVFASYVFQLSFATTATTIVSGAMAERCNFVAYCVFSFFNTFIFSLPAGWVWSERGFLRALNVVDIAGCSVVHLVGGSASLVASAMLKPRLGRYDNGITPLPMGSPGNALIGMFMLWWGWLGFNCGSTFGVSGHKWKYAARSAIVTINSSIGGGLAALFFSYFTYSRKFKVTALINGILASLVAITGGCALYHPWEALLVGSIGSTMVNFAVPLLDKFRIDDPVGAIAVHGVGSVWGMLAVGLFVESDSLLELSYKSYGLFRGGGGRLLGVQLLSVIVVASWSMFSTFCVFYVINKVIPIRMTPEEEKAGADLVEHDIHYDYDLTRNFLHMDITTLHNMKFTMEHNHHTEPGPSCSTAGNKPKNHTIGTQTEPEEHKCCHLKIDELEEDEEEEETTERDTLTAWMSDDEKAIKKTVKGKIEIQCYK